jgi:hypothetical protein
MGQRVNGCFFAQFLFFCVARGTNSTHNPIGLVASTRIEFSHKISNWAAKNLDNSDTRTHHKLVNFFATRHLFPATKLNISRVVLHKKSVPLLCFFIPQTISTISAVAKMYRQTLVIARSSTEPPTLKSRWVFTNKSVDRSTAQPVN